MSKAEYDSISRRRFMAQSTWAIGGMILGSASGPATESPPASAKAEHPIPTRILGKTNVPVTIMTLGTAPCGFSPKVTVQDIADLVNEAIDLGINSIDTAPAYDKAEEGVGLGLGRRRKEIFLATKVRANNIQEAEKSLANSFKMLRTDYIDLLYYHSLGNLNLEGTFQPEGVFTWLLKQKKAGKCRFIGASGHHLPARFIPFLESGELDVILVAVNFVDRHTYNFEERILPLARKQQVGIVAMKVFGGANPEGGGYGNPNSVALMPIEYLQQAINYALSLPGVATVNLGVRNKEQLRKNLAMVQAFQPLSPEEERRVLALGKQLAEKWGPHFGPVTEDSPKT
ncbi:MAG: aldo/keto reductase [Thermoguttaceae bacterium]|nr:aldo/keto reductase [Thermoguttaceae bacterium]MDW8038347.1 aldo/keto reductase [Thermoguttaceae bacterium]